MFYKNIFAALGITLLVFAVIVGGLRLSMKTRKKLTQKIRQHYRMVGKREKTVILTEFVHVTGHDRSYDTAPYGKSVSTVRDSKMYCSTRQKAGKRAVPPCIPGL